MSIDTITIFPEVGTNFELFAHQIDFVRWARLQVIQRKSFIFADDMGLGKTKSTLFLCTLMRFQRVLIVAPLATLYQWAREAINTCPTFEIYIATASTAKHVSLVGMYVHEGDEIPLNSIVNAHPHVIIITNYHSIKPFPELKDQPDITSDNREKTEPMNYIPELTPFNDWEWDFIAADEAHTLRNGTTISNDRRTKRAKTLKFPRMMRLRMTPGGIRAALTGTPIQNRKSDLVALLKWCKIQMPVKIDDAFLKNIIAERLFRRTKNDLHPELQLLINFPLEEPDIRKIIVNYQLNPEDVEMETQFMDPMEKANFIAVKRIEREKEQEFFELAAGKIMGNHTNSIRNTEYRDIQSASCVLERINMLRFLSASIDMFIRIHNKQNYPQYQLPTWTGSESKIEQIRDLIFQMAVENESVIVFVHFYEEADRIKSSLKKYESFMGENLGFRIFDITGETSTAEKDAVLMQSARYIAAGQRCLTFSNILCSNEGLNIQMYYIMVLSSMDWNPKVEWQAISRLNRIGQKKRVIVYRFIYSAIAGLESFDNIDAFMEGTKNIKNDIFDEFFKGTVNAAYNADRINMPGYDFEKAVSFKIRNNYSSTQRDTNFVSHNSQMGFQPPTFFPPTLRSATSNIRTDPNDTIAITQINNLSDRFNEGMFLDDSDETCEFEDLNDETKADTTSTSLIEQPTARLNTQSLIFRSARETEPIPSISIPISMQNHTSNNSNLSEREKLRKSREEFYLRNR